MRKGAVLEATKDEAAVHMRVTVDIKKGMRKKTKLGELLPTACKS